MEELSLRMSEIYGREGNDITYADMIQPLEATSEIQKFYKGTVIFLTGASGFIGSLIIEKLLRSCPDLSRIYILMRPKKGLDAQQRFRNMFNDVIFDRLNREQPKFLEKMFIVLGDCALPNLGLSPENLKLLTEEVDIVFHSAATVRFDEKLRAAAHINVRSTRDILSLAKEMKNLKAFLYISTAYSNCIYEEIDERFYDPAMSGDKLLRIVDELDDTCLDAITPILLKKWPNSYCFTKCIAENVIKSNGKGLPIAIVRPSMIISTAKEPIAGWINNFYGPIGVIMGASLGVIHVQRANVRHTAEVVPADYCVNAIIAATWQVATHKNNNLNKEITHNNLNVDQILEDEIPIYNYVTYPETSLTWTKFEKLATSCGKEIPSEFCIWNYFLIMVTNETSYIILSFLFHIVPAFICDSCSKLVGSKPRMMEVYRKIDKLGRSTAYFNLTQFKFYNNNTRALCKKLNDTDKQLFTCDLKLLDWHSYFYTYVRGLRVYLLKDPLETVPKGKSKYIKLRIYHYTLLAIIYLLFIKLIWTLFTYMFKATNS